MKRRALLTLSASSIIAAACDRAVADKPQLVNPGRGFRWISEFENAGSGNRDDAATLQRAIDYVREIAERSQDTSQLPVLLMQSGRYALNRTIETAPWVKLCSVGGVLLDFSQAADDCNGIECRNETSLPPTLLRFPGSRSPFLDGSGGTISILGPGIQRAQGWGVVMGNRRPGYSGVVRDAGGRNVVVSGWRGALKFDPINVYLSSWISSRFEQNREEGLYVDLPISQRSINSGERMTFIDCTIAGSNRAVRIDSDSMDFVFDSCSFDFNGDVVYFDRSARYGTVSLHHCHIEGIDRLLVDATQAGANLRVNVENSIVLPRRWKAKGKPNSPRRLVSGSARFSASAVEWRFEAPAQNPALPLIGEEVPVEHISGLSFQRIPALAWRGSLLNADSKFDSDPVGMQPGSLTHWNISPRSTGGLEFAASDANRAMEDEGQSTESRTLVLRVAPGASTMTIRNKSPLAVRVGQAVMATCVADTVGGALAIDLSFEFSDDLGNSIKTDSNLEYPSRSLPVARAVVPPGATRLFVTAQISGASGRIRITEFPVWYAN
ncbi:hypothetical protein C7401_12537 [Paraburkholderia unamae]|uniref:hypothetical protein n=1 Tax=Paraburkholderia unamae TaxID=219649 RepID=UPI000DC604FF|nr:hypothetical protein [Paraburkholderia unamae]RAR54206.1 hypothetical protein C7401_12537 [Paraburkholderia unamae]